MRVYCDECGHEFDFSSVKVKSKWIDKVIQKKYYNCPKCNHEFIVIITNAEIRKMISKYKALRNKYNSLLANGYKSDCELINKILTDMIALMDSMNSKEETLRKQYESNL